MVERDPFDEVLPPPALRTNDHETSIAAAEKVAFRLTEKRLAVLRVAAVRVPHGIIDDDLKQAFPGSPESTYRKRRSELAAAGYLENRDGQERGNRLGNDELVWHLTEKGRAVL